MSDDDITIAVWRDTGPFWRQTGQIGVFQTLAFTPTFLDTGDCTLTLDVDFLSNDDWTGPLDLLLPKDRLVTIDFRGGRTTWMLAAQTSNQTAGDADQETDPESMLAWSGFSAYAYFSRELAWPDPTKTLDLQPVLTSADPAPYKGPAETVIKKIVGQNLRDRYGLNLVIPPDLARGSVRTARPQMDKISDLVTDLAKLGGIGVDINLISPSLDSTRADLTLQVWVPEDKTRDILLTAAAGTLAQWEQADSEPTATKALVAGGGTGGMDRVMTIITTPDSEAAAVEWGGHRVVFVDGPSSFDPDEIRQAGEQALLDGASTRTLSLTSAETDGQQAFHHFNVGDKGTGEVLPGATVQDVITSIGVEVAEDGTLTITPTFGNPSATDAILDIADRVGALQRSARHQERK